MSSAAPTSGSVLGRALCIVTGTSRGFGRVVARDVSRLLMPGSALVIVARSGDDLRSLQAELAESAAGVAVKCVVADLGDVEGPGCVVEASKAAFSEDMDHIILVNNAGRWHSHINRFDQSKRSDRLSLSARSLYTRHYGNGFSSTAKRDDSSVLGFRF